MKSVSVNSKYQSTFLPIFQRAETKIKLAVLTAFLTLKSEYLLRLEITAIIASVINQTKGVKDIEEYIQGLRASSNRFIIDYYRRPIVEFQKKDLDLLLPKDAFMKSQAKGSVVIEDYAKKLKAKMKQLSETPVMTFGGGKKPISLWQKAELDVRYKHNMDMIEDLKNEGHDLCYISSHPDCSKRCEKWQGKLVSLTEHSKYSGFRVGKVDGQWVYSLTDIMAQKDKYGYNNNIISGFNCRHRLYPYRGQKPPTEYTKEEIRQQREIEQTIRAMEREIRAEKEHLEFLKKAYPKGVRAATQRVKAKIAQYKAFCDRNGYAWEQYRISV